jgi:hypothetical protein
MYMVIVSARPRCCFGPRAMRGSLRRGEIRTVSKLMEIKVLLGPFPLGHSAISSFRERKDFGNPRRTDTR